MKWKKLSNETEKTYAIIFDAGDEVMSGLEKFAADQSVTAARLSGIGALSSVVLGYFDWEKKDYKRIPIDEQVEVVSLNGDVALKDDEPKIHVHLVLGRSDGTALGGHLLEARVRPTLEVVLVVSPAEMQRQHDPESGLALISV